MDALRENLRWLMERYGLTENGLARVAAIPQSTLQRVMKSGTDPRTDTVARLGRPFALSPEQLRSDALQDAVSAGTAELPHPLEQVTAEKRAFYDRVNANRSPRAEGAEPKARAREVDRNATPVQLGTREGVLWMTPGAGKSRAIVVMHQLNAALRALDVDLDVPDYQQLLEMALAKPDSIALLNLVAKLKCKTPEGE